MVIRKGFYDPEKAQSDKRLAAEQLQSKIDAKKDAEKVKGVDLPTPPKGYRRIYARKIRTKYNGNVLIDFRNITAWLPRRVIKVEADGATHLTALVPEWLLIDRGWQAVR